MKTEEINTILENGGPTLCSCLTKTPEFRYHKKNCAVYLAGQLQVAENWLRYCREHFALDNIVNDYFEEKNRT